MANSRDHPAGHRRRQQRLPLGDQPDRAQQLGRPGVLGAGTRSPRARSASKTYSSSSKVVSTTTRVPVRSGSATIRRVASMPSMPGIRMSISTTSGRCPTGQRRRRPARRTPRRPAPGRRRCSTRARSPSRTRSWSSAISTRITSRRLHRAARRTPGTRRRRAARRSTAPPSAVDPLAHPGQTVTALVVGRAAGAARPRARVGDLDRHLVGAGSRHCTSALATPACRSTLSTPPAPPGTPARSTAAGSARGVTGHAHRAPATPRPASRSPQRRAAGPGRVRAARARRPAATARQGDPQLVQRLAAGPADRGQRHLAPARALRQQVQRRSRPAC